MFWSMWILWHVYLNDGVAMVSSNNCGDVANNGAREILLMSGGGGLRSIHLTWIMKSFMDGNGKNKN